MRSSIADGVNLICQKTKLRPSDVVGLKNDIRGLLFDIKFYTHFSELAAKVQKPHGDIPDIAEFVGVEDPDELSRMLGIDML
ncbi:hypothetical protein HNP86_001927 [Methanococcus maripaludis]|uniref:Uncharacterized protein n=1 Tax=Methanococcus maripaludis TaxID=39152 RepID=A0A7J9NVQ9_METMI|nr:hypothetical protein [Methanococcus maripaludis]